MNETPRLAVVGLGFGANHARVLDEMPGVELAAICDADPGRLAAAGKGKAAAAYTDYRLMLRGQQLDAVVVAVPAAMHCDVALAAIAAGCAVLVEKPLAPSYAAGLGLVQAAARAGVPLMAGHIERFNPALRQLAKRVRAGEGGAVLELTARRMGALRLPPQDAGVVHDSAIHDIDAMRFVLGAEVEQVYAQAQAGLLTPAENSISAVMRFEPVDGRAASGTLEVNWLSPRRLRDLAVLCEEGLFLLDYAAQSLELHLPPAQRAGPVQGWSRTAADPGENVIKIAVEPREQLVEELSAFVAALRDGGDMPVSNRDALATLAIADALVQSARSGQPVKPVRGPW